MSDSGWVSPGTVVSDDAIGNNPWSNNDVFDYFGVSLFTDKKMV